MKITEKFELKEGELITFVNPFSYPIIERKLTSHEIRKFKIYADGIFIVWLEKIIKRNKIERVSFDFTSIADDVFFHAENENLSVAFVGTNMINLNSFSEVIQGLYPKLNIKFIREGYFLNDKEWSGSLKKASDCDFVITGMGTPLQERFLLDLRGIGWSGTGFTCGGFMDQTAELGKDYYPKIIDKFNLRWLFRLYKEPGRLWKRYFFKYPIFIVYYIIKAVKR